MVSSRVKSRTNDYRMKMLAKAGLLDDGELSDNETVATEITATTYCSSDDDATPGEDGAIINSVEGALTLMAAQIKWMTLEYSMESCLSPSPSLNPSRST